MSILFIDHDDSFSNNIISYFRANQINIDVILQSDLGLTHVNIDQYKMIILSPGPGAPSDYPQTIKFYNSLPETMSVLGICLGHQLMLYASGGKIKQISANPVHGKQLKIKKSLNSRILGNIKLSGTLVLYNSLGCHVTDSVFNIWDMKIAHNKVCLMAEHSKKSHIGVQFHPESFGSTIGVSLLKQIIRFLYQ